MMIKRINLNEQVYESLKADILEQRIGFGEKLTNRELQERFGVSSTPVRDAINRLQREGLLDNINNVGAHIISFDANMALEINEVIAALSREAATLSIKKGFQGEVVPILRQCLHHQTLHVERREYFQYDRQFHQTFFDYCGNESLRKIYAQHNVLWELLVLLYYKDRESVRTNALAEHHEILNAYAEGNIAAVHQYMDIHFNNAVRPLTKLNGAG